MLVVATTVWGLTGAHARRLAAAPAEPPVAVRPLLDKYCVTCHNDRLRTAGLSLERLDVTNVPANAEVWEQVITKLRSRAMPPPRSPRPDAETSDALAAFLEATLGRAAAARPDPGRPAAHRLNRAEYANAIRDLLGLQIDARMLLPADDQGYGFDNNADVLTLSPVLMDRYMLAARRIARLAIGDVRMRPVVETYSVSRLFTQDDRMSEELPTT